MLPPRTINFHTVERCDFYYRNQFGEAVPTLPNSPSVHGIALHDPKRIDTAVHLDIVDRWTPRCVVFFRSYRTLSYDGDEAIKMFAAFNAFIYGKKE